MLQLQFEILIDSQPQASWKLPEREKRIREEGVRELCVVIFVVLFFWVFPGGRHGSVQFMLHCSVVLQFLLQ